MRRREEGNRTRGRDGDGKKMHRYLLSVTKASTYIFAQVIQQAFKLRLVSFCFSFFCFSFTSFSFLLVDLEIHTQQKTMVAKLTKPTIKSESLKESLASSQLSV